MNQYIFRTAVIAITVAAFAKIDAKAASPISVTRPLPPIQCTLSPSPVCGITVPIGNLEFVNERGDSATYLNDFVFTIIRVNDVNNASVTNAIANFDQVNTTYDDDPAGEEYIYVNFLDVNNNFLPIMLYFVLERSNGNCNEQGHKAEAIFLARDVYAMGAVSFRITQQTLTNPATNCGH